MAKTYAHLWSRLVAWDNLCLAYRKARRRKRTRPSAAAFESRRTENLLRIQRELASGSWTPGAYRHFMIRRPKVRRISAAPFADRVVHHAIVNVLEPLFERRFLHHSYACRVGKGTHAAVDHCHRLLRSRAWVLQGDVRRFFPSVDHEVLLGVVGRVVRDVRVLELLRWILDSGKGVLTDQAPEPWFPGDDLFAALRPRGLPIGNLTSQFLANVLLDRFDHHVAEVIRPRGYLRYCDDFVLFHDDRDFLRRAKDEVRRALASLRLHLHEAKTFVKPSHVGMRFLGLQLHPCSRRLPTASVRSAGRRLRAQARGLVRGSASREGVRASVQAWLGHTRHANATALTRTLLDRYDLHWAGP